MTKNRTLMIISLLIFSLTAVMLYYSSTVFLQLFIAFALAFILNPAVGFLEKKGLNRIVSIIVVFSAAVIIGAAFTIFMVVSITAELSDVQINLPGYAQHLYEIIPMPIKSYLGIETTERLFLRLNDLLQQARAMSPDLVKPLWSFIQKAFSSTIGLILAILGYLIIPVYLFYLLADLPRLKAFIDDFIPLRYRAAYAEKLAEVDAILAGFIRGQLSVCVILALFYSVGLYFIGIDMAIAIGTLAGVTFIIPYVGTIIGVTLSVSMAFLKFHDILHPLLCLGWFGLIQGLEGTVITPRVVGNTIGLHPLIAIVALLIGGQIFGLIGMLLAVPVTAVLQVFLRSLAVYYRSSEFYRGI
ncbi:MAG TPA: AI-2E family transporter [Desulfuromonadaceae bacterium]|jgi:predicted PurR-regulated permease PerM